jgi:four helix bundle protein
MMRQLKSAANSIVRNIAEGQKRGGRDPKRFFAYAAGSASEVRGSLDLAEAWGWGADVGRARRLIDRLLGLLWGLTH